jgi:hypothetical protein
VPPQSTRKLSERSKGSVPPMLLYSCSGSSNVARPTIAIDGCPLGRVVAAKDFESEVPVGPHERPKLEEPIRQILRPAPAVTA